jgi:hypothetical protein
MKSLLMFAFGLPLLLSSAANTAGAIKITAADTGAGLREAMGSLKDTIRSFETAAKAQADQVDAVMKKSDETLSALKDMGTAASERDARHMETLSKLLPEVGNAENVIELSTAKEAAASQPEPKKTSLWGFGTGA